MNEDERISPLGSEMINGLSAFCDSLESGEPIEEQFIIRAVPRDPDPKTYQSRDVKNVRKLLDVNQSVFARLLGVSVKSLSAWEQGRSDVPAAVSRVLDHMIAHFDVWKLSLDQRVRAKSGKVGGP